MEAKPEQAVTEKLLKYRPDIDGLRAIAVLFVVIFHSFPTLLKGGFIGVDIFFVISGFLISGIILEALYNNSFSYANFYARRIKRIFPALIVVLAVCLIAGWFLLFAGEYLNLGKEVAYGAGFLSNIGFWLEAGYFDISSNLKPLLHLWSLGVEEQFYLVWPILLVFLYKKTNKVLAAVLTLLCFSFFLNFAMDFRHSIAAFYVPLTRFWELMAGAFLAHIALFKGGLINSFAGKFKVKISEKGSLLVSEILSLIGVFCVFTPAFLINSKEIYIAWTLLAVIGVFLLIAAGPETFINKYIFSNKALVAIGLVSYPFYLWHWPLLSFANIVDSESVPTKVRIYIIIVSFILACLTYILIEKPARHAKSKIAPFILFLIMLTVGAAGLIVYLNSGFYSRFPKQEAEIKSMAQPYEQSKDSLCERLYPQKTYNKSYCSIAGTGANKIFIIGDSHTRAIYFGYGKLLAEKGYTVINLGIPGCHILGSKPLVNSEYVGCDEDIKKVITAVIAQKPKAIILSNNYWAEDKKTFESGMDKTLSYLPKSIPLVWVLQTPRVIFNPIKCVTRPLSAQNNFENCSFPKGNYNKMINGMFPIVERLKYKHPNLITVDPAEVLCGTKECPIVESGQFLYGDLDHLSIFGSRYLAQKMPISQFFPNLTPTKIAE